MQDQFLQMGLSMVCLEIGYTIDGFMLIDYRHSNGHNMGGLNFPFSDTEVGKYRTPRLLGQAHHGKHMPNMERAHVDPGWKQLPILEFLVLPYFDSNPECTYRRQYRACFSYNAATCDR